MLDAARRTFDFTRHQTWLRLTLGLSVRSLQRRLNDAGVSFSMLRDETRMREALILLTESRLSLAELALRLGYSEESAFSRAVKAWWGQGPRELRRGSETA